MSRGGYRVPFHDRDDDPVVNTHEYNGRQVDIRCASNGTFYTTLKDPLLILKDRSMGKLRKLLDAELALRQGTVAVPFLRWDIGDVEFEPDQLTVHKIDKHGVGWFRRTRCGTRDSPTTTRYGGEQFLRVLSEEERARLTALINARTAAEKAVRDALGEYEFDIITAAEGVRAGTYPSEHPKTENDRRFESMVPDDDDRETDEDA